VPGRLGRRSLLTRGSAGAALLLSAGRAPGPTAPTVVPTPTAAPPALPPEHVDRLFGMGQSGHLRGDVDFQTRRLLFVHPTLAWIHPIGARANPDLSVVHIRAPRCASSSSCRPRLRAARSIR
jgi:hypothetical protein